MRHRDLAIQFLEAFAAADLAQLGRILHEDFVFTGPFFHGTSAAEYLSMLRADPPEPSTYTPWALFEHNDEVCVLYRFEKQGIVVEMAQWFQVEASQIVQSRLIFDSRLLVERPR